MALQITTEEGARDINAGEREDIRTALGISDGDLPVITSDLVVYGANPGGLWAAMRARDLGMTVTVVNDYAENRIGGMLMGILHTDIPTDRGQGVIRMLARQFYQRVADMYAGGAGITLEKFVGDWGCGTRPDYNMAVLTAMLSERGITIRSNEPLTHVQKSGTRIVHVATAAGIYRGTSFLDATYHGDLLAAAGVSTFVGRESAAQYGVARSGVREPASPINLSVSPYRIAGDPSSGYAKGVRAAGEPYGNVGDESPDVQGIAYRLWDHSSNQPITSPLPGYDPADYILAKRNILAKGMTTIGQVITSYQLQDGSSDVNTNGGTGAPGVAFNWNGPETTEYVTATPARRAEIETLIKTWQWNYIYWLSTDTDLPSGIRSGAAGLRVLNVGRWGGDGWPVNIYLRQGRATIGEEVLTGKQVLTSANGGITRPNLPAIDPYEARMVCQLMYKADRHPSRIMVIDNVDGADGKQIVTDGGMGLDVQMGAPIDDRILYPKRTEVSNLGASFCFNADCIAQGSLRMEVTTMHLGEAFAVLAHMQKQNGLDVQAQLEDAGRLQAFQQTYDYWQFYDTNGGAIVYPPSTYSRPRAPVGVAGGTVTTTGSWSTVSGSGAPAVAFSAMVGQAGALARFYPDLAESGVYEVRLCWSANSSTARNNATVFRAVHAGGTATVTKDQNAGSNRNDTGDWSYFGTRGTSGTAADRHAAQEAASRFTFTAGAPDQYVEVEVPLTGGTGVIGAVKFIRIS